MANFELMMTKIAHIPIMGRDAAGDLVPLTAAEMAAATAKVSDPTAATAVPNIATGMLDITPLAKVAGYTVELDDVTSAGTLQPFTLTVDNVDDLTPTAMALDMANVTFTDKPPAAP